MLFDHHPIQVQRIVDETPKTVIGLSLLSVVTIWIYADFIPTHLLIAWILLQTIFIFFRLLNAKMLAQSIQEEDMDKMRLHTKLLFFVLIYSALVWNAGNIVGVMYAPPMYEFVSLVMMMGIVTAATISLSAIFFIYMSYFILMMIPQFYMLYLFGDRPHLIIMLLAFLYFPFVIMLTKSLYQKSLKTIEHHEDLKNHANDLYGLSITDALTQLHNRRYFYEKAQQLISDASRKDQSLSQLMIDIDHFKKINDTYGHQTGDDILIAISQKIQSMIRNNDLLARIGGEEFAILLPGSSRKEAKTVGEQICIAIERDPFVIKDEMITVTVSIGIAELDDADPTFDALYQKADSQLYEAKKLGRNRVC